MLDVYARLDKPVCFSRSVARDFQNVVVLDKANVSGSDLVVVKDESFDLVCCQMENGIVHLSGKYGTSCFLLSRLNEVEASMT